MKKCISFLILSLAMSVVCLGEVGPCLDNNITGQQLLDQQAAYEEARDKVVDVQNGDAAATDQELIGMVQAEADLATKSWIRAAIYCYLGKLKTKVGDESGASEAYKVASKYAKAAIKFTKDSDEKVKVSQDEGAKYLVIAQKHLPKAKKAKSVTE
jgi:hypothetical protein